MSTQPPNGHNHQEELMRASQANMAVAQPTKSKSASKATNNAASKQKAQMHRRSRTGLCRFPSCALPLTACSLCWTYTGAAFPSWPAVSSRLHTFLFVLTLQSGLQLLAIRLRI